MADSTRAGALSGQAAVAFFMNSGLPVPVLREVWALADSSQRHVLDQAAFAKAMRLIAKAQAGQALGSPGEAGALPKFAGLAPGPDGWTMTAEDRTKCVMPLRARI